MFSVLSKTGANLHHFSIYCIDNRRFLYFFKLSDTPFSLACNADFTTSLGKNCALVRHAVHGQTPKAGGIKRGLGERNVPPALILCDKCDK